MSSSDSQSNGILLPEAVVRQRLAPLHDDLRSCVVGAWERRSKLIGLLARPGTSFRAQAMYELMIDEARSRFGDVPGVRMVEVDRAANTDRVLLCVDPDVVIQFKKLDPNFRSRNYPTPRALAFKSQASLPGIPPGCRVTVGYQLNAVGTELAAVIVVCEGRFQPRWWYELVEAVPDGRLGTVSPLTRTRVRPKPQLSLPLADDGTGEQA